jgi:hypothetical protein
VQDVSRGCGKNSEWQYAAEPLKCSRFSAEPCAQKGGAPGNVPAHRRARQSRS